MLKYLLVDQAIFFERPSRRTGEYKKCLNCDKEFYAPKWLLKQGGGKYCSHLCYGIKKVGCQTWNKGTKGLIKSNGGTFLKAVTKFKGSLKQYKLLHYKIRKILGEPKECSFCGEKIKRIVWANKSGKYEESACDWLALCTKCHFYYDKAENRRAKNASIFL